MRKTKYYITTMRNGKNVLLQHGGLMYKYVPERKAWEVSDFWYDEIVMNAFTDFEEIDKGRADAIIANEGAF